MIFLYRQLRWQKGRQTSQIEPVQLLRAGAFFYESCFKWFDGDIKEIEIMFSLIITNSSLFSGLHTNEK